MHGYDDPKRIGEILVGLKLLSHFDVERVLEAMRKRQKKQKFGQMARDMGLIDEEQILAALAVQMQLLPGIERMTLQQILQELQSEPTAV
jgi:response regulator of citrate/malate metabolism